VNAQHGHLIHPKGDVGGHIMSKKGKIITRKGEAKTPKDDAYAIVFEYPTRLEITAVDNSPKQKKKKKKRNRGLLQCKRLSTNTYKDLSTQETKKYKKADNRLNSRDSLMKSLKDLGRLINNNFVGDKSEVFVTLTYGGEFAGKMYDTVKLYKDFKTFWQRLRYKYPEHIHLKYIAIPEPQGNGSWHIHALLKSGIHIEGKWHTRPLWIAYKELAEIWRHGFAHVERLTNPQQIVGYFYKGVTLEKTIEDEILDGADDNEMFVRGISQSHEAFRRFQFYPPGFKLYRYSHGIIKPVGKRMTYGEAKKLIPEGSYLVNSSTTWVSIEDENGDLKKLNAITHESYKIPKSKQKGGV
jgi:hypothetical protein